MEQVNVTWAHEALDHVRECLDVERFGSEVKTIPANWVNIMVAWLRNFANEEEHDDAN